MMLNAENFGIRPEFWPSPVGNFSMQAGCSHHWRSCYASFRLVLFEGRVMTPARGASVGLHDTLTVGDSRGLQDSRRKLFPCPDGLGEDRMAPKFQPRTSAGNVNIQDGKCRCWIPSDAAHMASIEGITDFVVVYEMLLSQIKLLVRNRNQPASDTYEVRSWTFLNLPNQSGRGSGQGCYVVAVRKHKTEDR